MGKEEQEFMAMKDSSEGEKEGGGGKTQSIYYWTWTEFVYLKNINLDTNFYGKNSLLAFFT